MCKYETNFFYYKNFISVSKIFIDFSILFLLCAQLFITVYIIQYVRKLHIDTVYFGVRPGLDLRVKLRIRGPATNEHEARTNTKDSKIYECVSCLYRQQK